MAARSKDVDTYIENAQPFAQAVLKKIRKAFHDAAPGIEEVMKWSVPHFEYKGVVGSMAAFKAHVRWGFWKHQLIEGAPGMGDAKVTSVDELPPHERIVSWVREAIRLNEEGVKVARRARGAAPKYVDVPSQLEAALKKNRKAKAAFDAFSPSHRREYADWIRDAKQEATKKKRIETAIEWLSEGKPRNWKYRK